MYLSIHILKHYSFLFFTDWPYVNIMNAKELKNFEDKHVPINDV